MVLAVVPSEPGPRALPVDVISAHDDQTFPTKLDGLYDRALRNDFMRIK